MITSKAPVNISGGISKIEIVLMSDLKTFIHHPSNNTIFYQFNTGKSFTEEYFTKDSVKFSSREEVTDNGNRYLYEIKWEVAGITKESNQALRANKYSRRLISITDTNGSRMLIPFMKLTSPSAIGDNVAKFTGHTVIFTANLPYPAPLDMSLGVKMPVIL